MPGPMLPHEARGSRETLVELPEADQQITETGGAEFSAPLLAGQRPASIMAGMPELAQGEVSAVAEKETVQLGRDRVRAHLK